MDRIWKSNMKSSLKKRFFVACIESILLYGCEAWAMTVALEKSLNGTYTRMLRKALTTYTGIHTYVMRSCMGTCLLSQTR